MRKMAYVLYLAGSLCLLYCFGIFLSGAYGSRFFLIWAAMGLILFAAAYGLQIGVWDKIPGIFQKAILALIFVCAAWFLLIEGMIVSRFWEKGEPELDYLIVLGAQMKENGPSLALQKRLDAAVSYLQENPGTVVIVSGGQGENEPVSEAEGMYRYLIEKGISASRICMEDQSRNTAENMEFSRAFVNPQDASVGIVTNSFHVYRSIQLAKKAGYQNVCGIAAGSDPWFQPNNMLREFFGVMKDWLCGNMKLVG